MGLEREIAVLHDRLEAEIGDIAASNLVLRCHACHERINVEYDLDAEIRTHRDECDGLRSDYPDIMPSFSLDIDIAVEPESPCCCVDTTITVGDDEDTVATDDED